MENTIRPDKAEAFNKKAALLNMKMLKEQVAALRLAEEKKGRAEETKILNNQRERE